MRFESIVLFVLISISVACTDDDGSGTRDASVVDAAVGADGGDGDTDTDTDGDTDGDADGDTDTDTDTGLSNTCTSPGTLKKAGECQDILIGAALNQYSLDNGSYTSTASREYSYVTAENEMKWERLQPTPGEFTYDDADQIVDFALENDMKVKGHCLVWHSQLPKWVEELSNPSDVEEAMKDHIVNVMDHFKGKIHSWDVVNEAIVTDDDIGEGHARMRDTVFYRALGEDFLDIAFRTAREQDSEVKLYYNDYSIDADNDKADFLYEMIKGMVDRDVPIDGVGFQMHIGTPNNITTGPEVAENMKRIADLGLEVLISEMDINLCDDREESWQEDLYYDVVKACVDQPACSAVTFWGVGDASSWLNTWDRSGCGWGENPAPLLFDSNYNKKETYHRVMDALTNL